MNWFVKACVLHVDVGRLAQELLKYSNVWVGASEVQGSHRMVRRCFLRDRLSCILFSEFTQLEHIQM